MAPAAAEPRQLTRAELRRLAQGSPAAEAAIEPRPAASAPVAPARRRSRPAADVPAASVPVAEAVVAATAEPTPTLLPTSPIVLPTASRRSRVRPPRETPAVFELLTPGDASNGPIAFAAAAADEALAADVASAEAAAADARAQEALDEFEAAARLFAFTGETPVQVAAEALADDAPAEAAHVPARRRGLLSFKRVATASFSIGVFGVVGLMAVGMTTPVGAVAAAQGTSSTSANLLVASDVAREPGEIQAYVAPADVQAGSLERTDGYEAASLAKIAADSGITNFSDFFVNDPTAAIQWPFSVGVPITYGFGMRSGKMHEGADFVPGAGSPVQAIADGTVRIATESGGAYGVTVVIDHIIDGELVSSRYAHMQYGSLKVSAGEKITVGTVVGNTGNTGRSFGAHTHFEILAGGTTAIDPIPWLREHAGG
ncbi:murein DD-endopeptidase MepM/ murein hydrolase activator NlpD [Microbacterium sp. AG1240]|uniref:M23 family metallopeptidase n=1 Tax=Microbacterium sp. AG1240 TaxID=2183992 RepID=UPI000EAFFB48|nr:M23 family metallopeptidase [Microbacterium sp. AG1240]RKT36160.1 murein DD-endopeptidase MepM/ murein hydrolase activator NlpD [Microbacterium sp. AG1240]